MIWIRSAGAKCLALAELGLDALPGQLAVVIGFLGRWHEDPMGLSSHKHIHHIFCSYINTTLSLIATHNLHAYALPRALFVVRSTINPWPAQHKLHLICKQDHHTFRLSEPK